MTLRELLNNPGINFSTEIKVNIPDNDGYPHYYNIYVDTSISDRNVVYLQLDGED